MNYIIIALMFCCVLCGVLYPKSHTCSWILMGIFFVIVCFSYDSYDYVIYTYMYQTAGEVKASAGEGTLDTLMQLGKLIGLNYNQFRVAVTLVEIVLLNSTFKKFAGKSAIIWALFLLFPGWWLTTVFRHTLALTIMIFGMRYFFDNTRMSSVKFGICIVLAGLIHSAFWFFLILLLPKFAESKTVLKVSFIVVIVMYFATSINIVQIISKYLPLKLTVSQYSGTFARSLKGDIFDIMCQLIIISYGLAARSYYNRVRGSTDSDLYDTDATRAESLYIEKLPAINFSSLMILTVLPYTSTATRLNHLFFIVNLIAWGICFKRTLKRTHVSLCAKTVALIVPIAISAIQMIFVSTSLYETVFRMIFETNEIINLFH